MSVSYKKIKSHGMTFNCDERFVEETYRLFGNYIFLMVAVLENEGNIILRPTSQVLDHVMSFHLAYLEQRSLKNYNSKLSSLQISLNII